eukprot:3195266-Amphidinium_carterae.2
MSGDSAGKLQKGPNVFLSFLVLLGSRHNQMRAHSCTPMRARAQRERERALPREREREGHAFVTNTKNY